MRAFALSGFAALAISMMAPATVWAWSTEQASPNSGANANLAEQEDPLKALQDKVNGKTGSQQSGFYFSTGPGSSHSIRMAFRTRRIRMFRSASRLSLASAVRLNSRADLPWRLEQPRPFGRGTTQHFRMTTFLP